MTMASETTTESTPPLIQEEPLSPETPKLKPQSQAQQQSQLQRRARSTLTARFVFLFSLVSVLTVWIAVPPSSFTLQVAETISTSQKQEIVKSTNLEENVQTITITTAIHSADHTSKQVNNLSLWGNVRESFHQNMKRLLSSGSDFLHEYVVFMNTTELSVGIGFGVMRVRAFLYSYSGTVNRYLRDIGSPISVSFILCTNVTGLSSAVGESLYNAKLYMGGTIAAILEKKVSFSSVYTAMEFSKGMIGHGWGTCDLAATMVKRYIMRCVIGGETIYLGYGTFFNTTTLSPKIRGHVWEMRTFFTPTQIAGRHLKGNFISETIGNWTRGALKMTHAWLHEFTINVNGYLNEQLRRFSGRVTSDVHSNVNHVTSNPLFDAGRIVHWLDNLQTFFKNTLPLLGYKISTEFQRFFTIVEGNTLTILQGLSDIVVDKIWPSYHHGIRQATIAFIETLRPCYLKLREGLSSWEHSFEHWFSLSSMVHDQQGKKEHTMSFLDSHQDKREADPTRHGKEDLSFDSKENRLDGNRNAVNNNHNKTIQNDKTLIRINIAMQAKCYGVLTLERRYQNDRNHSLLKVCGLKEKTLNEKMTEGGNDNENNEASENGEGTNMTITEIEPPEKNEESLQQCDIVLISKEDEGINRAESHDNKANLFYVATDNEAEDYLGVDDDDYRAYTTDENTPELFSLNDHIHDDANKKFVTGLDDINKFFEEVDPPDELDVGAGGKSIHEILMAQGTHILKKRLAMALGFVRNHLFRSKPKNRIPVNATDYYSILREMSGGAESHSTKLTRVFPQRSIVRFIKTLWRTLRRALGWKRRKKYPIPSRVNEPLETKSTDHTDEYFEKLWGEFKTYKQQKTKQHHNHIVDTATIAAAAAAAYRKRSGAFLGDVYHTTAAFTQQLEQLTKITNKGKQNVQVICEEGDLYANESDQTLRLFLFFQDIKSTSTNTPMIVCSSSNIAYNQHEMCLDVHFLSRDDADILHLKVQENYFVPVYMTRRIRSQQPGQDGNRHSILLILVMEGEKLATATTTGTQPVIVSAASSSDNVVATRTRLKSLSEHNTLTNNTAINDHRVAPLPPQTRQKQHPHPNSVGAVDNHIGKSLDGRKQQERGKSRNDIDNIHIRNDDNDYTIHKTENWKSKKIKIKTNTTQSERGSGRNLLNGIVRSVRDFFRNDNSLDESINDDTDYYRYIFEGNDAMKEFFTSRNFQT